MKPTILCLMSLMLLTPTSLAAQAHRASKLQPTRSTAPTLLTVRDVIRMVRNGENTASIIEKIQNAALGSFDPAYAGFSEHLKREGVPQVIVNEMVEHQMLYSVSSSTRAGELSNQDVRNMLGAGLSPTLVLQKIKNSQCDFDTSPAALAMLKRGGVPRSVIVAMLRRTAQQSQASRSLTDHEYLAQFPACADLLGAADQAGSGDSNAFQGDTQDVRYILDALKRCADDSNVKNSKRGSDAAGAELARVSALLALTALQKQRADYQQLADRYNWLAAQYNARRLNCMALPFGDGSIINCN